MSSSEAQPLECRQTLQEESFPLCPLKLWTTVATSLDNPTKPLNQSFTKTQRAFRVQIQSRRIINFKTMSLSMMAITKVNQSLKNPTWRWRTRALTHQGLFLQSTIESHLTRGVLAWDSKEFKRRSSRRKMNFLTAQEFLKVVTIMLKCLKYIRSLRVMLH